MTEVAGYRILEVQIVLNVQLVHFDDGGAGARVRLNVAWGENRRPEEAILRDTGVEIVNLCAPQTGGVVDVNSDKREGARPNVAISSRINPVHKGHVIFQ